jgi:L-aspartate oxidase
VAAEGSSLPGASLHVADLKNSVQALMWRAGGILRSGEKLQTALRTLERWYEFVQRVEMSSVAAREVRNLVTVATLVMRAALWRAESRGTHFRLDFPSRDDQKFLVHGIQRHGTEIHARTI